MGSQQRFMPRRRQPELELETSRIPALGYEPHEDARLIRCLDHGHCSGCVVGVLVERPAVAKGQDHVAQVEHGRRHLRRTLLRCSQGAVNGRSGTATCGETPGDA